MTELPEYMTTLEVASLFRVNPRTVHRWARLGQLRNYPTPGGQMRFRRSEIRGFLEDNAEITEGNGA